MGVGGVEGGSRAGNGTKLGKPNHVPDLDTTGAVEREAAQKLQQAIERIKANRERRARPTRSGAGSAPTETRRDW